MPHFTTVWNIIIIYIITTACLLLLKFLLLLLFAFAFRTTYIEQSTNVSSITTIQIMLATHSPGFLG